MQLCFDELALERPDGPRREALTACSESTAILDMADLADTTSRLLEQWHAGDKHALAALIELHLPWLRNHIARRLGGFLRQHGDTTDYLQDAMVEFLEYSPRFQVRGSGQFRSLLARVAENTMRDRNDWFHRQRRDLARNTVLPNDSVLQLDPALLCSTTPSRFAATNEARNWVRLGLELLEAEDRKILIQHEYENQSFVTIGKEVGLSANAVRMRWVRAVARLAQLLKELRAGSVQPADALE